MTIGPKEIDRMAPSRPAAMQVAQKAYILDPANRLLMVRYGAAGNHDWDLPGGRVEDGEADLDSALAREVSEETGLTALVGRALSAYLAIHSATRERALFLIREVTAVGNLTVAGQVPEDDIADARWVPLSAIPTLAINPCVAEQLLALVVAGAAPCNSLA